VSVYGRKPLFIEQVTSCYLPRQPERASALGILTNADTPRDTRRDTARDGVTAGDQCWRDPGGFAAGRWGVGYGRGPDGVGCGRL